MMYELLTICLRQDKNFNRPSKPLFLDIGYMLFVLLIIFLFIVGPVVIDDPAIKFFLCLCHICLCNVVYVCLMCTVCSVLDGKAN